jgi:hypothetical protein
MVRPMDERSIPPEIHGNLAAEQEFYVIQSESADEWLRKLHPSVHAQLWIMEIRCPVKGCLLGQVFRIPLKDDGERFLFVGSTLARGPQARILNWGFSDDWSGPPVWFPVTCRHGQAKLERAWLLDLVGLVRGWHHALETIEEVRRKAPVAEQRGIRRRVFHPKPEVWRGKRP